MNERIRELFEKHTIPNFGPFNGQPHKNVNGEYHNPVIEDHWQTFQEAAELIVRECVGILETEIELVKGYKSTAHNDFDIRWHQGKITHFTKLIEKSKEHFGVEE